MQKSGIYTIKDIIADEIGPVFESKNDLVAYRMFRDVAEKSQYPGDYVLIRLGWLRKIDMMLENDMEFITEKEIAKKMEVLKDE